MASSPDSSADAPRPSALGGIVGGVLLGVFGLLVAVPLCLAPIWRAGASLAWAPTPCTILSSAVVPLEGGDGDGGGPTWTVALTYAYEAPDPARGGARRAFTGTRWRFTSGATIGRGPKQRVVDANPPGARRTCHVDPADPSRAVLSRAVGVDVFMASITLAFPVFGFGLAFLAWRRARRPDAPRRPVGLLAFAAGVLWLVLVLGAVYVELLTPPFDGGAPAWGPILGLSPFLLLGLYSLQRSVAVLRARREQA